MPLRLFLFGLTVLIALCAGGGVLQADPRPIRGQASLPIAQSPKIHPLLRVMAQELKVRGITRANAAARGVPQLSQFFIRVDNRAFLQSYIHADAVSDALLAQLEQAGVEPEIVNRQLGIVQAWIPYESLDAVAELAGVQRITVPSYGISRLAKCANKPNETCVTEGDAIHRSDELRAVGFDGTGVKVGVISDGVDSLCDAENKNELPGGITPFGTCNDNDPCSCNDGDEGVAMLEIIYDMAPGATFGFGAGLASTLAFIDAVDDLMNVFNADVIVDDLGFFLEPYFEDGALAQKVEEAVSNGVFYASAAGNDAEEHYEGDYQDSNDGLGSHQISNNNNTFEVFGSSASIIVQWTNEFGSAADDYDLCVSGETAEECANFNTQQDGDDDPVEFAGFNCSNGCSLQVRRVSGSAQRIELFVLGGALSASDRVAAGSIFGHAAVDGMMAAGAIDASDPGNDDVESYSSQGPAQVFFPGVELRDKPDISAVDGVEVGGFGGFPSPFFGTSAAAPHVAGGAAQLMGGFTTAQEIRTALMDSAVDIEALGFDFIAGEGRMDVYAAAELLNDAPDSAIDSPGGDIAVIQGDSVNLQGTCTDPNSTVAMEFLWEFEAGSGIGDLTVEDPGSTQFNNVGVFDVTFTCSDGFGVDDPSPVVRTITVDPDPVTDTDGDGVPDAQDNCPNDKNAGQEDNDQDGLGDVCDPNDEDGPQGDLDGDTVVNVDDNCLNDMNAGQEDNDQDGLGDVCDPNDEDGPQGDLDGDTVVNVDDNCPNDKNAGQEDNDQDGLGDVCDPNDEDGPQGDLDGDTVVNVDDNCPNDKNAGQEDNDQNGLGDVCDPNDEGRPQGDLDGDMVVNVDDNCPNDPNADQADTDNDGIGDVCDPVDDSGGSSGGGTTGGGDSGGGDTAAAQSSGGCSLIRVK